MFGISVYPYCLSVYLSIYLLSTHTQWPFGVIQWITNIPHISEMDYQYILYSWNSSLIKFSIQHGSENHFEVDLNIYQ